MLKCFFLPHENMKTQNSQTKTFLIKLNGIRAIPKLMFTATLLQFKVKCSCSQVAKGYSMLHILLFHSIPHSFSPTLLAMFLFIGLHLFHRTLQLYWTSALLVWKFLHRRRRRTNWPKPKSIFNFGYRVPMRRISSCYEEPLSLALDKYTTCKTIPIRMLDSRAIVQIVILWRNAHWHETNLNYCYCLCLCLKVEIRSRLCLGSEGTAMERNRLLLFMNRMQLKLLAISL